MEQWIRIHLPKQGSWVRSLIWENSTCHRAAEFVGCKHWARPLEPPSRNYWVPVLPLLKPVGLEPVLQGGASTMSSPSTAVKSNTSSPQLEKAHARQWRPRTAKKKKKSLKKLYLIFKNMIMKLQLYFKIWSLSFQFSSVQLLSCVWHFATPWTTARQSSLSITNSQSNAIQPSQPLSPPSPPALNLSQHQGLFKWVSSSHQVAKVLEFQLQHQSYQWTPRTDLL